MRGLQRVFQPRRRRGRETVALDHLVERPAGFTGGALYRRDLYTDDAVRELIASFTGIIRAMGSCNWETTTVAQHIGTQPPQ